LLHFPAQWEVLGDPTVLRSKRISDHSAAVLSFAATSRARMQRRIDDVIALAKVEPLKRIFIFAGYFNIWADNARSS
jgi:hypothetical protein